MTDKLTPFDMPDLTELAEFKLAELTDFKLAELPDFDLADLEIFSLDDTPPAMGLESHQHK